MRMGPANTKCIIENALHSDGIKISKKVIL